MSITLRNLAVAPATYRLSRSFSTALRSATHTIPACDISMTFSDGRVSQGIAVPVEEVTGESPEACLAAISGSLRDCLLSRDLSEPGIADILDEAQTGPAAKSGVEMAWRAAFDQAPHGFSVTTDATVSLASTAAACEQAEYWVNSGFTHLKVKADSRPTISSHIKAIAAAVPDARLRIDPNQSWTLKQARLTAEELANADVCIDFIEQPLPVDRDDDLVELCAGAPFPIAADESARSAAQLSRLARAGVSVAIVKIGKAGGWQRALEMAGEADQLGMSVIVSTMLEPLPCVVEAARLARQVAPEVTHDLDAALFFVDGPDSYRPPHLVV